MLAALRTKLTYANVTATLALVIAIGGGSAYAIDEWDGSNIEDETLTGADIRGSRADGTDGSLKSEDIRDGTLASIDIALNSLTGSRIRENTISGLDVNEPTLAQVPDAAALGGVPLSGVARAAGQQILLGPNESTGLKGRNLGIPGFGLMFAFCPEDPPNHPGSSAFINRSGGQVEAWVDVGDAAPQHARLQNGETLSTFTQPRTDLVTFVLSRQDQATATVHVGHRVNENLFAQVPYTCTISTHATWRTP